jgi:hypothetical protein
MAKWLTMVAMKIIWKTSSISWIEQKETWSFSIENSIKRGTPIAGNSSWSRSRGALKKSCA